VVSSTSRPHFTPGKDPVPILQEAGWAPGPGWTGGKSRPHRDSIPDRPTRSQSLYLLSYRAHILNCVFWCKHLPSLASNCVQPTTTAKMQHLVYELFETEIPGHYFLNSHSLTPHSTVLLEKPTGSQPVKKFPAFYGTRRFITALTSAPPTCPYPEPTRSSPYPHIPLPEDPS